MSISMNGRICVVTGATHGIGLETARVLAAAGATVVVHGRDLAEDQLLSTDADAIAILQELRTAQLSRIDA